MAQGSDGQSLGEQLRHVCLHWNLPETRGTADATAEDELAYEHVPFPIVRVVQARIAKIEPYQPRRIELNLDDES